MVPLDEIAPNFHQAKHRWPQAPTLANHYDAAVQSYEGNGHSLVETVKSFIECVCLTILGEFGKPMPSANPSTTELLVETLSVLGLKNTRGASKLDRVLSAHNKLADALSDMRNGVSPVAHGKDGFLDNLTGNHLRTYLLTGDTILGLLMAALDGKDPDLQFTREPYERFLHLHGRIDGLITVETEVEDEDDAQVIVLTFRTPNLPDGVELRVEPSRLLYNIDRDAYIELLASSSAEAAAATALVVPEKTAVAVAPVGAMPEAAPLSKIVPNYSGFLLSLKEPLQEYITSLALPAPSGAPDDASLIDSLLATAEGNMGMDWNERDALQSRMKVGFRRTLAQFGITDDVAKNCAEHLVSWFRIQAGDLSNGQGGTTK